MKMEGFQEKSTFSLFVLGLSGDPMRVHIRRVEAWSFAIALWQISAIDSKNTMANAGDNLDAGLYMTLVRSYRLQDRLVIHK